MAEQQRPPLPEIKDGTELPGITTSTWLDEGTRIELEVHVTDDGSYHTSVLTIGAGFPRSDIFAKRTALERLYKLIGRHLDQLDEYERARQRAAEGWK